MTTNEFTARLAALRGATPITLETRTIPAMRKTANPLLGRIVKIGRLNGFYGFHYSAAVDRQRIREMGDDAVAAAERFVASPRKWGQRIESSGLVTHLGRVYVEIMVLKVLDAHYETLSGAPIPAEAVRPFLNEKRSNAQAQGVIREIIVRDYAIESITGATWNGERHEIDRPSVADVPRLAAVS